MPFLKGIRVDGVIVLVFPTEKNEQGTCKASECAYLASDGYAIRFETMIKAFLKSFFLASRYALSVTGLQDHKS